MEKRRLFVGSLPNDINEDIIRNRFRKYGEVLSVELKHRYSGLNENDILSTFAFVDLQASPEALSTCLKKLSRKKWNGKEVTVQFAKESVLSRLENERKENVKDNINKKVDDDGRFHNGRKLIISELPRKRNESSSRKENVNDPSNVNDSSNIMTKLEMFSDTWKDCDGFVERKHFKMDDADFTVVPKDKYENNEGKFNAAVVNYDSSIGVDKNVVSKNLYSKQLIISSEERRQKSVEKMKKEIDQRKLLVKKALSSVDSGSSNKKIIFNDDEEFDNIVNNDATRKAIQLDSGNQLFNDESGDEEEEQTFNIKQQFEGEKGKKLFQLQSKFGNDTRFFMDERFYESDEDRNNTIDQEKTKELNDQEINENDTASDEIKKQLEILQSVVGDKDLARQRKKQKFEKPKETAAGVRFDPSIPEHEKFIMKPSNDENSNAKEKSKRNKNKEKRKLQNEEDEKNKTEALNNHIVQQNLKETFYEVTDELKESFKSAQKSSFSFSELFKSSSGESDKRPEKNSENSPYVVRKTNSSFNSFNDDRFGGDFHSEVDKSVQLNKNENKQSDKPIGSLWHENFFYKQDDPRLEEAHNFFSRENLENVEEFQGKRKELKKIIKKKVMNRARNERPFKKKIRVSGGRKNFKRRRLH